MQKKSRVLPIRPSIKLDGIHPRDWRTLNMIYCCEQCTHFDPSTEICTIGYHTKNHLKRNQDRLYELRGKVAFCRFTEVD